MAKRIIVNDKDEIIGYKERNKRTKDDIVRVAGLWIFNDKKETLIAKRTDNKAHDPNKWGPSAAGSVEKDETYVSNIIKEAKEEISITLKEKDLILGPHRFVTAGHQFFSQSFFAKMNLPIKAFKIQKEEVAEIRWIGINKLLEWVHEKPDDFIESFRSPESSLYDFAKFLSSKPF